jgi:hypothetical protein
MLADISEVERDFDKFIAALESGEETESSLRATAGRRQG